MEEKPVVVKEGFSPVQGCLMAAVILFVLLLGVSIVLAYRQFRENTSTPATPTAGRLEPGAGPRTFTVIPVSGGFPSDPLSA